MTDRVFQLQGTCNNYPWGKKGQDSLAARLCKKTDKSFEIKDDEPYSEMWFGDYPDFPARVLETGEPLKDVLDRNKETLLGKKVIDELGGQLPFLPKILSIAKALPLQIHPNKDLAAKLHAQNPSQFTDPNHKPEIAIALSKFELFAGFKPLSEIAPSFQLPPLRPFVPPDTTNWTDATLRAIILALLKAPASTISQTASNLLTTDSQTLRSHNLPDLPALLPRLQSQYAASDPATLIALTCMNFLVLSPGEALYIPADGIHAYLSGDIVECMARSNNVLNAGFCPVADRESADLFAGAMGFEAHSRGDMMLEREGFERGKGGKVGVYRPPMREFEMVRVELGKGEKEEIVGGEGPGVMIVTRGKGRMEADGRGFELGEGGIFFVAPGVGVRWETEAEEGLEVYMAVV